MQLSKLELKGFKSFADRVVIHFDEGITSIVGPNGCGKSNVVDSIRWVLGEQKIRALRSDKMENVIFNGSKDRKPTQMAEVSLMFNNTKNLIPTEYSQVTITRRYYRSGESEYLLNGVSCRLKDITNLFLDTGIASNNYAIIELKMVDELLNDKDQSRRSLFEEAAGISKFKIRKKETLRKLNDTDTDLDRVEDLLFEIEKNLTSLKRQADRAKKHYKIKEEYKKFSIILAKRVIVNQKVSYDNILRQIREENDKKLALTTLAAEKESAIEQSKADLVNKEKHLSLHQKTLNEHVNNIRRCESDKKIKSERRRHFQDKIKNLKEQIASDEASNDRVTVLLDGLYCELEEARLVSEEMKEQVESLKVDYENQKELATEAQQKIDQLNDHFSEEREHYFQIKKEIEFKSIHLKNMLKELDKTSEDSMQQNANVMESRAVLAELVKEKEEKILIFESSKVKEDHLRKKIERLDCHINEVKDSLSVINRQLDSKQNEYNLTKSLIDNLEGFPGAIKFLKKDLAFKDVPLLSDIIYCPEEYRVAIENFLEPYMNYYVVQSHREALNAIRILGKASKGRANFFILNSLESFRPEALVSYPKAIHALSLIDYDSKYEHLIQFLLANVFIYKGSIPKKGKERIVLLDKEGKISLCPFSISGGSVGLFEGKRIGRVKNLKTLDIAVKQFKKEQEKAEGEVYRLQSEREELIASSRPELLERLKDELTRISEAQVSIQTKQEQFNELLSHNKTRRTDLQQQVSALERTLDALRPEAEKRQRELKEIEDKVLVYKGESIRQQELLNTKSSLYNKKYVLFHQGENKISGFKQEIVYKRESLESNQSRIERHNKELETTIHSLNQLARESMESDDELVSMYEEKETLEKRVNGAEKNYYEARALIDEEEKQLKEVQRQRENVSHVLMEWQEKLNVSKMHLNSVKERLSVEFNVDVEKVHDEEWIDYQNFTEEALRDKVEKCRKRMDSIGTINPMSMEAYEEIKERHKFITKQKEDLLSAKESLFVTINEVEEVARKAFMESFHKIRENFVQVFRTLFTEDDDCDLTLIDPENPLESAIEIIAKPKGKRPLTINQLSGGEKTLTATSLLFSIYLLKPAPFCIFDEVDAPLDDANIDKFNNIIRRFSQDSQFIIVTHNKRTMLSTDVIYGITMQEQGVSKVVPIDLKALAS